MDKIIFVNFYSFKLEYKAQVIVNQSDPNPVAEHNQPVISVNEENGVFRFTEHFSEFIGLQK